MCCVRRLIRYSSSSFPSLALFGVRFSDVRGRADHVRS